MNQLISILFAAFFTTSCATNTGIGVMSGGGVGAGAGGLLGGWGGALVGAAAGALSGGLLGAVLDEQDRKVVNQSSPRTLERMDRGDPLTLNDVIRLSQVGVSDETIIKYLNETGSIYQLTQTQIRRLQDAGVSERIIHFMAETRH
ncbi:MAG TPA: hypothetical protein VJK48_01335 [Chlamydiales bacterium]|nr:hypothetical protein [Chlamydiales bacterium]